jgi:hypothetical protein
MVKIALVWVFPEYFGYSLSVSFHQCSILIFIYIFVLPEVERIKSRNFPKINALSDIGESTFTFFVFIILSHKYMVGKPDGKNHLEDSGFDGRIILRWIFWKWGGGQGLD